MRPNKSPSRILAWLAAQPPAEYFSLEQLCAELSLGPKRTSENLSRLYFDGHLARTGERTRYQYRLATPAAEVAWKPDRIRPLVASLGVILLPAMPVEWREAA